MDNRKYQATYVRIRHRILISFMIFYKAYYYALNLFEVIASNDEEQIIRSNGTKCLIMHTKNAIRSRSILIALLV